MTLFSLTCVSKVVSTIQNLYCHIKATDSQCRKCGPLKSSKVVCVTSHIDIHAVKMPIFYFMRVNSGLTEN